MSGTTRTMTDADFDTAVFDGAITVEEIKRKRRTVQIGDKITLRQQVQSMETPGAMTDKLEVCTVIAKYPALVIFQRPRGRSRIPRLCSRTWVELCMADRPLWRNKI